MSTAAMFLAGALAASIALAAPQDRADDALAIEARLETGAARCWLGEPVEVTLRIEWDEEWLERHVLQPFQQPLGLPVSIETAALRERDDAVARPASFEAAASPGGVTLLVDGRRVAVERVEGDARDRAAIELTRAFLPTRAGRFELAGATLRFATTSGFEEDLLGRRVARDRQERAIEVAGLAVEVVDLPEDGRPAGFGGAVGSFSAKAAADPRELSVGETVRVVVTLEGAGNFEQIAPPPWEPPGFERVGELLHAGERGLVLTYDLVPRTAGRVTLPEWSLDCFDPGPPAGYRRIATAPIGIEVAAATVAGATEREAAEARERALAEALLLAPLKVVEAAGDARATIVGRAELGLRACRDGDFTTAQRWFTAALEEPGAPRGPLLHDLGHARFAAGDPIGALAAWLVAAHDLPGDPGLASNVALAARRLDLDEGAAARLADHVARPRAGRLLVVRDGTALCESPSPLAVPRLRVRTGTLLERGREAIRRLEASDGATSGWLERAAVLELDRAVHAAAGSR